MVFHEAGLFSAWRRAIVAWLELKLEVYEYGEQGAGECAAEYRHQVEVAFCTGDGEDTGAMAAKPQEHHVHDKRMSVQFF